MHRFTPSLQRQRFAALTALAAFAVHQLRYLLAGHAQSGGEHGHGYLAAALPLLVSIALALVIGCALAALAGRPRLDGGRTHGGLGRWLGLSALLAIAFVVQELAEGALVAERQAGLGAVLADGGWLVFPLALVLGGLLALTLRGLDAVDETLASLRRGPLVARAPHSIGRHPQLDLVPLASLTLAFGFARRPPPAPRSHC